MMPNRKLVYAALLFGLGCTTRGAEGPPAGLSVKAISAGYSHALALASDGTVWAWGGNVYGQLGDGTTTDRPAPVTVPGLSEVVGIAAGATHSLALKGNGSVWAWGKNDYWTTTPGLRPVQMSELSGVVAISALGSYSLALKGDGTVWAWDNTMAPSKPVPVAGLTGVVAISGGGPYWGLALKGDGTVWAWGSNFLGQLGDGTTTYRATPVQVSGLAGVVAVMASDFCGLAVKADGTVWEWGYGVTTPVQVSELGGVVAVAARFLSNLAVKADGTVWVWDWWYGPYPPVQVSGLTGITAVSVGGSRLALKGDGSVWAWGWNGSGQLGDGTYTILRPWPGLVSGLSEVKTIAAGASHSLAVKADGTVWAWGDNSSGQLGDGTQTNRSAPVQARGLGGVVAVAGGTSHSLALKGDGTVWDWGSRWLGEGDDRPSPQLTPAQVSGISGVVAIAAGNGHSLAVKRDGTVWAWGRNGSGQLGDGTTASRSSPAQVSGLSEIVAVAGGSGWDSEHSLALKDDGTVWAWGNNNSGQLGDGTDTNRSTRVRVNGLSGVIAIAAGSYHSLAVKGDGTLREWGAVDGIAAYQTTPVQRRDITAVTASAAGGCLFCNGHSLAMRGDGTVWAWGNNESGQLGDATRTNRITPVQVAGLARVVGIAAGWAHSLAVKGDGTVWAWGHNRYGQLGMEPPTDQTVPVQVVPLGSPDLAIAITHEADFTVGDPGLYNLTITNIGRTATAGTITVTDILPPGLVYSFGAGSGWTCMAAEETVTCTNPGPVEAGASTTIALSVRVESPAWPGVTNLASVTNASDRNLSNNTVGDPTVVLPEPH